MSGLKRFVQWLAGDRRGVTSLEFALGAPVLLLVLVGTMELASVMFVTTLLEGSVRDASRFGITGYMPGGLSREQRIMQIVAERTVGLVDMEEASITTLVYESFGQIGQPEPYIDDSPQNGQYDVGEDYDDVNGNGQWDPDIGLAGAGGPGDVVVYRVNYEWKAWTPIFSSIIGQGGKIPLSASIAVRNEPYNLAQGS